MTVCSVDGCGKSTFGRGWCEKHYRRWYVHGDPHYCETGSDGPIQKWVNAHLNHSGEECLLWPFNNTNGYGAFARGKKLHRAHRVFCEARNGKAPSAKHHAAHKCGNRTCVNPTHLRWATASENQLDKLLHGTMPIGERHRSSVLKDEDVLEIRSLVGRVSIGSLARRFGVCYKTIQKAQQRRTWRHLP